jgi:hypothetical protein
MGEEVMGEKIRTAVLREVFDIENKRQFGAKLARVCVLFEDLRIEVSGINEPSMPALDILDPEKENWFATEQTGRYRKFYFIRRSILTLYDFPEAIRLIVEDMTNDPTGSLRLTFSWLANEPMKARPPAADGTHLSSFSTPTKRGC